MHPTILPPPITQTATRAPRALSSVADVALHYGFIPTETLRISKEDRDKARALMQEPHAPLSLAYTEEKIALIKLYDEEKMERLHQPAMFYREERNSARSMLTVHLDVLGSVHSIAEAMLIKTVVETLREAGSARIAVRINSVGDRDSLGRFIRELGSFYRKKIAEMHAPCRQAIKENIFAALLCEHELCIAFRCDAPRAIGFLSEPARAHFKEVLEYLERLEIPYELHEHLLGPSGVCSQTVFDMRDENGTLLASGFRYNHLARRVGARREIPALGATLFLSGHADSARSKRFTPSAPKVYFIQLGPEAKRRSLHIIEMLRRAEIPLVQSIAHDKLSTQIAHAESLHTPFFVIMGQKEASEGTALVRDRERSFQETLPIPKLSSFLKRLIA
ncbi:MAG: His/Gly/Thr/Pro-type tRNA ligase C-terminal domain-containing protein [bacterium]|nr:His/Gly/Thr/Pro-type tRNA ligase C-terminal domain-containing protein [bacterium]